MAIQLRQTAEFARGEFYGQTGLRFATFDQPTLPGSLILVVATQTLQYDGVGDLYGPSGYPQIVNTWYDELAVAMWYQQNAPATSSIGVYSTAHGALIIRLYEYTGAAQANVLDQVTLSSSRSSSFTTGTTGTTSQGDELVFGVVSNRYGSTHQTGFTGGLTQLSETRSPQGDPFDSDDQRCRLTTHHALVTTTAQFSLGGQLTTSRDWIAVLATFKSGSLGPARMTARNAPPAITISGRAALTAFGPLKALNAPPAISITGRGRIGPFALQQRLFGWDGLLIGASTPYRVESIDGLGGGDVRVSDTDLARGDGASRGIDLQAARLVQFKVNFDDAAPAVAEQLHADLMAALVPQRDTDGELLFRLPGRPLQLLLCRPIQMPRAMDGDYLFLRRQQFVLRAADPRIYSATEKVVEVANTPAGQADVTAVSVINEGNGRAYPVVQVDNRDTMALSGIQLVNATGDVAFEVATVIPPGSQLIGDMPAWITQAPRSVIRLDGQAKYGAWAPPRDPLFLEAAPVAVGGVNAVYLRTTPAGADVVCTLTYRDTWAV
ncbi:MAG: hypothetical protein L0H84_08265 [Pseudonocardia sp.]|nr:hypothetical protein [Pseudonocardia sp.]